MIRVSKIAHAAYETPDLAQQTEYYTDIIGLTLAAQEKDCVYFALGGDAMAGDLLFERVEIGRRRNLKADARALRLGALAQHDGVVIDR